MKKILITLILAVISVNSAYSINMQGFIQRTQEFGQRLKYALYPTQPGLLATEMALCAMGLSMIVHPAGGIILASNPLFWAGSLTFGLYSLKERLKGLKTNLGNCF